MADPNSTRPPMHSRSSNGTPLYEKVCPNCGVIAVADYRKLGKPCHPCAMKKNITHGHSVGGKLTPIYRVYLGLMARCNYPSASHYKYYGARGIRVCAEWANDPQAFITWALANGWHKGLEVDRKDGDGNYYPDNCRILTHRENSQRTRRIKTTPDQAMRARGMLVAGATIKDAAAATGVTYMVAWHIKNSPDVWSNV